MERTQNVLGEGSEGFKIFKLFKYMPVSRESGARGKERVKKNGRMSEGESKS